MAGDLKSLLLWTLNSFENARKLAPPKKSPISLAVHKIYVAREAVETIVLVSYETPFLPR